MQALSLGKKDREGVGGGGEGREGDGFEKRKSKPKQTLRYVG